MDSLQIKCGHIYMFILCLLSYLENGTELLELCTVCELPGMLCAAARQAISDVPVECVVKHDKDK
jgi:hypothetical protein